MFLTAEIQLYLLVFVRISALLLSMPFFSARGIPPLARGGLIFFISLAVMPMVRGYPVPSGEMASEYLFLLAAEIFIGCLMGFLIRMIFAVFQTAGEIFSMQMAFSAAQIFDPIRETESPLMSQFFDSVGILLFLTAGPLQQFLLEVVAESFLVLPRARLWLGAEERLLTVVLDSVGFLLEHAFFLALPIVGSVLFVSVTLGLMAKAAPQMNLLVLGFPIQSAFGFFVLFLALPFLLEYMLKLFQYSLADIKNILGGAGEGVPLSQRLEPFGLEVSP